MSMISFSDTNNEPLKKLIEVFIAESGIKPTKKVLLLNDKNQLPQSGFDIYVVPYGFKSEIPSKSISYSLSDNRADVVLINIQNHSQSKSFEIMTNSAMGRVFINNKNNISVDNVLMCATVFLGLDLDLFDVLDVLNDILK